MKDAEDYIARLLAEYQVRRTSTIKRANEARQMSRRQKLLSQHG
jgi:hypothetical protein